MDKAEATNQILMMIEMFEESGPFTGRANILKRLNECYNLIILYKPTPDYYQTIVSEAKSLLNELQIKMDKQSKGGN